MNIKPIETHYNGYRFRSRLEARWAVFFDKIGQRYEYEPEGFDLGVHGRYLPDFYLPDIGRYIEVKPTIPSKVELKKCLALLKNHISTECTLLVGQPKYPVFELDSSIESGLVCSQWVTGDDGVNGFMFFGVKLVDGCIGFDMLYGWNDQAPELLKSTVSTFYKTRHGIQLKTCYISPDTYQPIAELAHGELYHPVGYTHLWNEIDAKLIDHKQLCFYLLDTWARGEACIVESFVRLTRKPVQHDLSLANQDKS